jgi:rhodanese-related sulfurtransferase
MDGDVRQVPIADFPVKFGPSTVLLDVREHDERKRSHAPGATHIPMAKYRLGWTNRFQRRNIRGV